MSMIFGIVFLLVGLALAVLLGIVLYRDPKQELRPRTAAIKAPQKPEAA